MDHWCGRKIRLVLNFKLLFMQLIELSLCPVFPPNTTNLELKPETSIINGQKRHFSCADYYKTELREIGNFIRRLNKRNIKGSGKNRLIDWAMRN